MSKWYRVPIIGYVIVTDADSKKAAVEAASDILGGLEFKTPGAVEEWNIEAVDRVVQGNFWLPDAPCEVETLDDNGDTEWDDEDDEDEEAVQS